MVAPLGDLDVGEVARRGEEARRRLVVEVGRQTARHPGVRCDKGGILRGNGDRIDGGDNLVQLARAKHGVDLRKLVEEILAIAFDEAAGDDQPLQPRPLLQLSHLENRLDRLLLRRLDEAAGVDDHHIGLFPLGRQLVAPLLQLTHHHFTVDKILRTAEADEAYFRNI